MLLAAGVTGNLSSRSVEDLLNIPQLRSVLLFAFIVTALLTYCSEKTNDISANQQQQNTNAMKKILIIGMDPHTIDFTNPEIPEGLTVEKIERGAQATLEKLHSLGYSAELFLIETGATDVSNLELKRKKV